MRSVERVLLEMMMLQFAVLVLLVLFLLSECVGGYMGFGLLSLSSLRPRV